EGRTHGAGPGALARLERAAALLRASRPTAVNLAWACARMTGVARDAGAEGEPGGAAWAERLEAEALAIWREDLEASAAMARHGAALFPRATRFLTHCNTGGLATGGGGTALGVLLELHRRREGGIEVWATETRPLLQGARLTAWELRRAGVETRLVTDGAAAYTIERRGIEGVLVGADRIARNGDVANKIGTYALALAARASGIPFVVVAPTSTLDAASATGADIRVEERDSSEVTAFAGVPTAPEGVLAENPAFDVTPHELVTAVVTEFGSNRTPGELFQRCNEPGR
ncbi:MAG TPA: S-methyl-5-thioribose-1-phosphate isomerase, partial [Acidobacteriota bacterium]|nr:S-methyl-5-thioribose-1-phosphate isomerase [Acidobacteriota bacterium]